MLINNFMPLWRCGFLLNKQEMTTANCVGWRWSSKLCACAESLMSNRWRPSLHSSKRNCLKPQGWSNRHVAATSMNRESSRSNAVFTVSIESKDNTDLPDCCVQYQCFLKAFWASERVSQIFPTVSQNTVEPLCTTTTWTHLNFTSRPSRYSDEIVAVAQNVLTVTPLKIPGQYYTLSGLWSKHCYLIGEDPKRRQRLTWAATQDVFSSTWTVWDSECGLSDSP